MSRVKLSDYAKRKIAQWSYKRRKMLEFVRDSEAAGELESVAKFRGAAAELLAAIKHVRSGKPAPLPPAPWIAMIAGEAEMGDRFEIAEWNRSQTA